METLVPHTTLLWGGLLGLVMAFLAVRVTLRRRALMVSLGDGGDEELLGRIRAFGNYTEYVPMALVLMALVELGGGAVWFLHLTGFLLFVARLSHGLSLTAGKMSPRQRMGRQFGTGITFLIVVLWSVYAVILGLF